MTDKTELVFYFLLGLGSLLILAGLTLFILNVGRDQPSSINIIGIVLKTTNAALIVFVVGVSMILYGIREMPVEKKQADNEFFCTQLQKIIRDANNDFKSIRTSLIDSGRRVYFSSVNFWSDDRTRINDNLKQFQAWFYEGESMSTSKRTFLRFQDRIDNCFPNISKETRRKVFDSLNYYDAIEYITNRFEMRLERNVYDGRRFNVMLRVRKVRE